LQIKSDKKRGHRERNIRRGNEIEGDNVRIRRRTERIEGKGKEQRPGIGRWTYTLESSNNSLNLLDTSFLHLTSR